MKIRFIEPAISELDEAVAFYERERSGLGRVFLRELRSTLRNIVAFPEAWHALSRRTRRCQLRRFPYAVIYHVSKDTVLVVAIAHLHRRPEYWKDRIKG
ncbi:MAG: type II toxin-antitoxin system RelE/ParE family toxin [Gammaproteobacteria bacterium]|nr:type II toxin-antitoxin system RelE/ParE family toxin [Gammaproteobacteria bacterium]